MNIENVERLAGALSIVQAAGPKAEIGFSMANYFMLGIPGHEPKPRRWSAESSLSRFRVRSATVVKKTADLAGWAQIVGAVTDGEIRMGASSFARGWLDIPPGEGEHVLNGLWSAYGRAGLARKITCNSAVTYLKKAAREKSFLVSIQRLTGT